jgi:hypothetical protein
MTYIVLLSGDIIFISWWPPSGGVGFSVGRRSPLEIVEGKGCLGYAARKSRVLLLNAFWV